MSPAMFHLLLDALWETLAMVAVSALGAAIVGIPAGVVLIITGKGHILENLPLNRILGASVNVVRSVPFIILLVAIIPLTRLIVGTSIGLAYDGMLYSVMSIGLLRAISAK